MDLTSSSPALPAGQGGTESFSLLITWWFSWQQAHPGVIKGLSKNRLIGETKAPGLLSIFRRFQGFPELCARSRSQTKCLLLFKNYNTAAGVPEAMPVV